MKQAGYFRNISKHIPYPMRVEYLRLRRKIRDRLVPFPMAGKQDEDVSFSFALAQATSPLERVIGAVKPELQRGKERNVKLVAEKIHGLVIAPGEVFSYHALVGRPSRRRGFQPGLELHNGAESVGIGGGACQVSNMLYLLAISSGMRIVERHRHGLDLFPDHLRSVPFGCGATVFYNYADFRFENPLSMPVVVRLSVQDGHLEGAIASPQDPGFRVEILERDHRFFEEDGARMRENKIHRIFSAPDGQILLDELLAHNRCRVTY